MNDEIKEILYYYQKDIDRYEKNMKNYTEYQQKTTFSKNYQRYKNHKLLLDYITNLQEENERLNMVVTIQEDYKSKNEKAIEYLKDENNIIDLFTKHDFRKYPDYNAFDIDKPQENINCVELYGYDDLLNILQGSDKE